MLTRYCDDEFDPESSTATIGIDFKVSPSAWSFENTILMYDASRLRNSPYEVNHTD